MRITEEQRAILDSLVCERLSRNSSNMREIDSFFNSKNEKLVERLLNEASDGRWLVEAAQLRLVIIRKFKGKK